MFRWTQRRAMWRSRRGLLLVEAILSAVVISIGLVFITRGLGSQLNALRTIEEYDALAALAQSKFVELEGLRLAGRPLTLQDQAGTFKEPYEHYRWTISVAPRAEPTDAQGAPLTKELTLVVQQANRHTASLKLTAVWPTDWVPPEWH